MNRLTITALAKEQTVICSSQELLAISSESDQSSYGVLLEVLTTLHQCKVDVQAVAAVDFAPSEAYGTNTRWDTIRQSPLHLHGKM